MRDPLPRGGAIPGRGHGRRWRLKRLGFPRPGAHPGSEGTLGAAEGPPLGAAPSPATKQTHGQRVDQALCRPFGSRLAGDSARER